MWRESKIISGRRRETFEEENRGLVFNVKMWKCENVEMVKV